MKRLTLLLATALAAIAVQAKDIKPMKEFVDELMARMTLEEKIGQLNLQVAGNIVTGGQAGRRVQPEGR